MRILHISDLHFGAHNEELSENLKHQVKTRIRPDVILATGDLADQPDRGLLVDARNYLLELEGGCCKRPEKDPKRPRVLVIPGNHYARYWGSYRLGSGAYKKIFVGFESSYYFKPENVWIYGFDSSLEPWTGANGRVEPGDLEKFREKYDALQKAEGFDDAFKVAAVHHHPVPIKYDAKSSRWLSLTNAAEFLNAVLSKKIDLILHGHEHIRARTHYGRHLRHDVNREIPIISVGTALKKNHGEDRNCFYVIEIKNHVNSGPVDGGVGSGFTTVQVSCYEAEGNSFGDEPIETFEILSAAKAVKKQFDVRKTRSGYYYGDVASIAKINSDGDALRIVECHDLTILDSKQPRSSEHNVSIPSTSGYIDMWASAAIRGDGLAVRFKSFDIHKQPESQSAEGTIQFGRAVTENEKISYQYSWWAVNGFAMDQREAWFKYGEDQTVEFTHYPVVDPMEALTVMVQFPDDPALSPREFQPRVVSLKTQTDEPLIAKELRDRKALRYYETLRTVALWITKPLVGYSYGIQWPVPSSPSRTSDIAGGQVEDIVKGLLEIADKQNPVFVKLFLSTVANRLRNALVPSSKEELEVGLMVFDRQKRKMVMVASASFGEMAELLKWCDYSKMEFRYGESLGGKIFKTNKPRLYAQLTETEERERKTPNFYLKVEGTTPHAVLLGIPIQSPGTPTDVYGVICCGAYTRASKLWEVGRRGGPIQKKEFEILQESLNELCFNLLGKEILGKENP